MNYYGCGRVIRSFYGEPDLFMARIPELKAVHCHMTAQDLQARVMQHLAKLPFALWQTQFNLFDSHDTPRFHNDPAITQSDFKGAACFQFLLTGAPSIYYGDEAEIDGTVDSNEGCRYPMPWQKQFRNCAHYRLYHTLCALKKEHPALRDGSMKFLYAQGDTFSIARFIGEDVVVGVISKNDAPEQIRLPLGALGASEPAETEDLLGTRLHWQREDDHAVSFRVEPHSTYLFACKCK